LDTHQNWEQKQTRGLKFERDFWYGPKKGEIVKGERRKEELKSRREILYLFIIVLFFSFLPKKKLFHNCFNFFFLFDKGWKDIWKNCLRPRGHICCPDCKFAVLSIFWPCVVRTSISQFFFFFSCFFYFYSNLFLYLFTFFFWFLIMFFSLIFLFLFHFSHVTKNKK
jgi:hypothetical protein